MAVYKYEPPEGQSSVNPIRDETDLKNFIGYFKKLRNKEANPKKAALYDRNYMLILVGVNTALRFSDLRRLTVEKVKYNYISQRDKKTGKENRFSLNKEIYKEVVSYIKRNDLQEGDFLFRSQQGYNQPLTRQQGYNIMQEVKKGIGIHYPIGTHTLRKTFGFWFYREFNDVVALQTILNHTSPQETLRYIGMQKIEVEEKRKHFILKDL